MEQSQLEANLNSEEIARYARHISLPEIGIKGQEKLKTSSVACIGTCLLYTSPSPRDRTRSRMPSSA